MQYSFSFYYYLMNLHKARPLDIEARNNYICGGVGVVRLLHGICWCGYYVVRLFYFF